MIRGSIIAPNGISYHVDTMTICGEPIDAPIFEPSPDIYIFSKWWFTKKYR